MTTELDRLPDPPGPRPRVPLGSLMAFRRDPLTFLMRLHDQYGDVSSFRIGKRWFYLLGDPEHVRDVLVTRNRNFIKSMALQRSRVLLGTGLLTSEGDFHLRQRRMAQPAFHRERIAAYARTMTRLAGETAERWSDGETVDAAREMNRLTLAIAGRTLFGADVQGEADEISRALTDALGLFSRLTNPFAFILDRLPVPGTVRMRRARERLDATIYRMIEARRAGGGEGGDLLSMLLAARDDEGDGGAMTDLQLRDEALTLFLAGHETTANALAWTWHLLAANPAAESALHTEVDAALAGRTPTADDLPLLPYTRAVVAESMRLRPPAWSIGREPLADFELGGYRIRAGSVVLMSPWVTHHDARFFPEPEAFRPERWLGDADAAVPRMAYFPFGAGPRKCIGEGFAWMELTLVLATLAQRWRLRPASPAPVLLEPLITLRPRGGLPMRVERRD
ncbi:MAG TPA: cytochrome P450 [Longimicrobiaceae bacterium]|jgi:cytochrome P450|nr:cytochrome P450 [Longimicrobiaceae bacterium]